MRSFVPTFHAVHGTFRQVSRLIVGVLIADSLCLSQRWLPQADNQTDRQSDENNSESNNRFYINLCFPIIYKTFHNQTDRT